MSILSRQALRSVLNFIDLRSWLYRHWCRSNVRHHLHYHVLLLTDRHDSVLSGGFVSGGTSLGQVSGVVGSGLCGLKADDGERHASRCDGEWFFWQSAKQFGAVFSVRLSLNYCGQKFFIEYNIEMYRNEVLHQIDDVSEGLGKTWHFLKRL